MNKAKKILGFKKPNFISGLDPSFKSEVLTHPDAQGLNACFSCGTCSAGCPIHEVFPEYNPKKLAKMVRLGMRERVLGSPHIWYCATCHNCEQRCPQNVRFFNVLNVLKNMAAKEGYAPSVWVEQTKQVIKTGMVFSVEDDWIKERKRLSLPPLKETGEKVKKVIEQTGIDKIKPRTDLE
jgi:heterodisulfide reductase subunit C